MSEAVPNHMLNVDYFFPSPVYMIEKPEFLEDALIVSNENLNSAKQEINSEEVFENYHSQDFSTDPRIEKLSLFIAETSWKILYNQGYDMDKFGAVVSEMWAQEHNYNSGITEHVHAFGAQLSGFYFLEAHEEGPRLVIHDPRPGKKQINLPERDMKDVSVGSLSVNFPPKAGQLYFTNSYLPHEFTRNMSKTPLKFIHFNVGVSPTNQQINPLNNLEVV